MDSMQVWRKMQSSPIAKVTSAGLVLRQHSFEPVVSATASQELTASSAQNAAKMLTRKRLSEANTNINERIWPVNKHWGDANWGNEWCLYWVPATFANKRNTECEPRLLDFIEKLIAQVRQDTTLRQHTFFDSQLLHPFLLKKFVLQATEYFPIGLTGFRPEAGPCKLPEYEDVTSLDPHKTFSMLQEKKEGFSMSDLFPSSPPMLYCLMGEQDRARKEFMGRGGYTLYVSKLAQSQFFERSKELLAKNTTDEVMLRLPMTVPLFSSASFTRALQPELKSIFSLFELYISESPRDKGLVIAASRCIDEEIAEYVSSSRLNASGLRSRFGGVQPKRKAGLNS